MRIFLIVLLGCLYPMLGTGQSFRKVEKLFHEVLADLNKAYEENNPAVLRDIPFEKKVRRLRNKYLRYHAAYYDEADSIARVNNEAVLMALYGQKGKAAQRLSAQLDRTEHELLRYHLGLVRLLNGDYQEAYAILKQTQSGSAGVNTLVAAGNLPGMAFQETVSSSSKAAFNQGILAERRGEYEIAIHHYSTAMATGNLDIYRLKRGDAYLAAGQTENALADYAAGNGRKRMTQLRKAFVLLQKQAYREAEKILVECAKSREPAVRYPALLGLANSQYAQQNYGQAREYYERVMGYKPLSSEAQTGLAQVAFSEHKYRTAKSILDRVLDQDSTYQLAALGRAAVRYALKDYEGALADFHRVESLLDQPEAAVFRVYRGWSNYFLGQSAEARKDFEEVLSKAGDIPEAHAGLGLIAIDERRFPKAGPHFVSALAKIRENDRLWVNYGNLLLHFGMYEKAYSVFGTAVKINRLNLHAQNGRGITLLERDMLDQSKALFDSLIRTNPGRSVLLNNRGIVHAYRGNKFSQAEQDRQADFSYRLAEKDFDLAMESALAKKFYHVNKGNVFRYWHEYEAARQSYQNYQDKSALNNTAVLLAGLEKYNDARYYMGVALQIDSTHRVFHYNMDLLNRGKAREMARFLASARDSGPYSEISIKYSLDGYVTIYLYDYEYQQMEFPVSYSLPAPAIRFGNDYLIPEIDFRLMPYAEKAREAREKKKTGKSPKIRMKGRAKSGTHCPVFS